MRILAAILAAAAAGLAPRAPETPCAGRTGFASGTVGELGGRMRDKGSLYILDNSERPSVLVLSASCEAPQRIPLQSEGRLQTGGIARASDGSLCALTPDGRHIDCFDEASGRRLRQHALDGRAQSVWTIRGRLAYARFEPQPGRPLIYRESTRGFEPDGAFTSRAATLRPDLPFRAPSLEAASMVENLVQCGLGTPLSVPCWRVLTGEIRSVGAFNSTGDGPEFLLPELPHRARAFPLRDALRTPTGVLWLLVNDPPEKRDEPVGPGRRLVRLHEGRMRVVALDLPARLILDGDDEGVLLLFRDGSASRRGPVGP